MQFETSCAEASVLQWVTGCSCLFVSAHQADFIRDNLGSMGTQYMHLSKFQSQRAKFQSQRAPKQRRPQRLVKALDRRSKLSWTLGIGRVVRSPSAFSARSVGRGRKILVAPYKGEVKELPAGRMNPSEISANGSKRILKEIKQITFWQLTKRSKKYKITEYCAISLSACCCLPMQSFFVHWVSDDRAVWVEPFECHVFEARYVHSGSFVECRGGHLDAVPWESILDLGGLM